MIKRYKWLPRISKSKKNTIDTAEGVPSQEDTTITKCDSDETSSNSVMEKTHVYHYTNRAKEEGHSVDVENEPLSSPAESTDQNSTRRPMTAADAMESFECIYGEEEFIESRDDIPPTTDPGYLRGAEQQSSGGQSKVGKANVCRCGSTRNRLPHLHPSKWPQAPLLLRPHPSGGTRILGIRKEGESDRFLWKPGQVEPWWEILQKEWGQTASDDSANKATTPEYCEYCVILPINNGNEEESESLVVDFESSLFEGTLLLRLRETNGTTKEPYDDSKGYFAEKQIRYQVVLRGRFKTALPFSNLITGTQLERPCGKLPPKWVMWTAMKVIHFFAPQLQTQLEKTDRPFLLSPLGSAPRTIIIEDETTDANDPKACNVSKEYAEPTEASKSILGRENLVEDPLERARARRKVMDHWFIAQIASPRAQTDKTYTFEFLQHLFDYQNFTIELGKSFHVNAKDILNGQPLQILAEHREVGQLSTLDNTLWSFQIWNECLWNDAMESLDNPETIKI